MKHTTKAAILFAALAVILTIVVLDEIAAIPSGATLSIQSNSTSNGTTPSARNDSGGYIYVANINTVQQDSNWKAYVGNVTGSLTLDDSNNKSIYDWDISTNAGEIYASRAGSITWPNIGCAGPVNVTAENAQFGFGNTSGDNVNGTFNTSTHKAFVVGTRSITASTCNATALYINNTRQAVTETSRWQEVLLTDNTALIFTSLMEDEKYGFDNMTYDFQMIVPENGSSVATTTYYFWVELG